jgi:hypothetical protein
MTTTWQTLESAAARTSDAIYKAAFKLPDVPTKPCPRCDGTGTYVGAYGSTGGCCRCSGFGKVGATRAAALAIKLTFAGAELERLRALYRGTKAALEAARAEPAPASPVARVNLRLSIEGLERRLVTITIGGKLAASEAAK